MPEVLWKAYIDLEISEAEYSNARALYERLLQRSSHVKVWIAYAMFEFEYGGSSGDTGNGEMGSITTARAIFTKG